MNERTCAMVVIGNEILSGKVQDTNAYFTARELRKLGVALKRIAVVPDEIQPIVNEVSYCAKTFDFVLTSGGVGPTHDDITIEAIAAAFGRKLMIHPELERIVLQHFKGGANAAGLKMTQVPEGAVLNAGGDLRFPTVQLENVYILPGIPQIFERKLMALAGRFTTDPYFIRTIFLDASEGLIAEYLNQCLGIYPELLLGSYPRIGDSSYRVKLTLESKDVDYLQKAFDYLMGLLPRDAVVKVE
ncbi:MAG TPA: competence/damage-inducible protein A [Candidatus Binataceae bacterium]|nr:competence/damage-inducible protein A [Candidatus Binataceae bacterium]